MSSAVPAVVLGGTGYVAGELLRLIAQHPQLTLAAVMSDSMPGEPVAGAFPHLQSAYPQQRFSSEAQVQKLLRESPRAALFSAAPHGVSAALIDRLLTGAEQAGTAPRVVDISADFRYATADAYTEVYRHPHAAPGRLAQFSCALPEHLPQLATRHVGHPGCFATAVLLASVPLLAAGLVSPTLFVSGVTAEFAFVPHSGPFARGIHVTLQAALRQPWDTAAVLATLREFYADAPFVRVSEQAPRIKDVVASNYAHLSAAARGNTVAVLCAIDNLTKGAAGGAIQWMNRMLGFAETAGLTAPAPGWT